MSNYKSRPRTRLPRFILDPALISSATQNSYPVFISSSSLTITSWKITVPTVGGIAVSMLSPQCLIHNKFSMPVIRI